MVSILNAVVLRWFDLKLERAFELRAEVPLSIAGKHRYDRRYRTGGWALWRKDALVRVF